VIVFKMCDTHEAWDVVHPTGQKELHSFKNLVVEYNTKMYTQRELTLLKLRDLNASG